MEFFCTFIIKLLSSSNYQNGCTALMNAVHNGHENVVETLLQHGSSMNLKSRVSVKIKQLVGVVHDYNKLFMFFFSNISYNLGAL